MFQSTVWFFSTTASSKMSEAVVPVKAVCTSVRNWPLFTAFARSINACSTKASVTFCASPESATVSVVTAPTMVTFGTTVGARVGDRVGQNMCVGGFEGAGDGTGDGAGV